MGLDMRRMSFVFCFRILTLSTCFASFVPFNATAGLAQANILKQSTFCPPLRYEGATFVGKVDVAPIPIVVPSRHAWLTYMQGRLRQNLALTP